MATAWINRQAYCLRISGENEMNLLTGTTGNGMWAVSCKNQESCGR